MSTDLFVFAGEKSADLHGEGVLRALKEHLPSLRIAGVGGPKMRCVGMECVLKMEDFQVMGFIDVFLSLPSLVSHFYAILDAIKRLNPQVVLTIDYPGFNLRLARALRKRGFKGKICHYICPSVWAWGKKRIPILVENFDLLLTILPFEKQIFANTPLHVEYVGHPLIAKIRDYAYKPLSFPTEKKILALFPGSRKKEIERNLPLQLQVARKLSDFHIALSLSDERFAPLIHSIISQAEGEQISLIPADYTYELMRAAHAAIAKSGTVTLELALHETPTAVTYGIGALDLFIAKDLLRIRLPYYCLVNIIAQDEVFTEFIGPHFTEENLLAHMHSLLLPSHYARCQEHCQHVRALLGDKDASREAAYQLQHFLSP